MKTITESKTGWYKVGLILGVIELIAILGVICLFVSDTVVFKYFLAMVLGSIGYGHL